MNPPDYRHTGIFRRLGISPELMAIVITVDFLLFGGELFTTAASPIITIPTGFAVGVFSMIWQKKKYKDNLFRSVVKGILLGVITAIPTPVSSLITVLAGVLPLIDKNTDKQNNSPSDHSNHLPSPPVDNEKQERP